MYLPDVVNSVYQLSLKQKIRLLSLIAAQIDDETEDYPWDNDSNTKPSTADLPIEMEGKVDVTSQIEK